MTSILQTFIPPTSIHYGSKEKYYRQTGNLSFTSDALIMSPYAEISFDTYYNGFSIPLWRDKTGIRNISLSISGQGEVEIQLYQVSLKRFRYFGKEMDELKNKKAELVKEPIDHVFLTLSSETQNLFNVNITDTSTYNGLLYLVIIAKTTTHISSISWQTPDEEKRHVELGIAITHFNRKQFVLPAIKRINEQLIIQPEWQKKIQLLVVDNSQNITSSESNGVKIIPNKNTGGTGGFMRGFLYYKQETSVTHVLFMDDDASLEIESIKRAYSILKFANSDKAAVGAALFYDTMPDIFIERGAKLNRDSTWRPQYCNARSNKLEDLLVQELDSDKPDYTGWWFTAFPIKYAEHLPLPYFVRGDDVSFGVANDFDLILGTGIACLAEAFNHKVSPMMLYLDRRNKLIVHTLFINKPFALVKNYFKYALLMIWSLRQGYYQVIRKSMMDFQNLTGNWLIKNSDMRNLVKELTDFVKDEKLNVLTSDILTSTDRVSLKPSSKIKTMLRFLTFNRLIIPLKEKRILQRQAELPHFPTIAGYREILYFDPETEKGYVVKADRKQILKDTGQLLVDCLKLFLNYRQVRRRLLKEMPLLTNEVTWCKILEIENAEIK